MTEPKARCRYLRRNQEICNVEVAFEGSILLCQRHLFEAYLMLREAGGAIIQQLTENAGAGSLPEPHLPPYEPRTVDGIVYYLRFGDRIKIGTTTNLAVRLKVIPHDELLATEPGGYEREQTRHREFGHCQVLNEWFRGDDPKLLAHIGQLRRAAGLS